MDDLAASFVVKLGMIWAVRCPGEGVRGLKGAGR
jgi:hypothetical protein